MTTAPTTKFCRAKVEGPGGFLWVDGNAKITIDGTYEDPQPNAFSLTPSHDPGGRSTCPGSTPVCRTRCYVHGLRKHAPETYALYQHNRAMVGQILAGEPKQSAWATAMADWITEHAPGGFRWHVSGDVFSLRYAQWIDAVCACSPEVTHWIYTRTLTSVGTLSRIENMVVNVSADRDNLDDALFFAERSKARICYLATEGETIPALPPDSVIFPDYPLRGDAAWFAGLTLEQQKQVCPVDYAGKSEERRCGVCKRCLVPWRG